MIKPYLERKQEAQKQLQQDTGWRRWKLRMQSVTNKKLEDWLRREKKQRKSLEKQIKKKE